MHEPRRTLRVLPRRTLRMHEPRRTLRVHSAPRLSRVNRHSSPQRARAARTWFMRPQLMSPMKRSDHR
jgi:hypothetical protein